MGDLRKCLRKDLIDGTILYKFIAVVNSLLSNCYLIPLLSNLYFRCPALFGKLHVSTKGTIEDNGAGFLQVLLFITVVCWSLLT